jgi:DNA-binding IscR family transcriptional regulator
LGGYALARPADAISFYDVIEALEGPISVNVCLDNELGCDQLPRCTMIGVWTEIQRSVTEVLSRTTIAALRRPACKELLMASSSLSSAA